MKQCISSSESYFSVQCHISVAFMGTFLVPSDLDYRHYN